MLFPLIVSHFLKSCAGIQIEGTFRKLQQLKKGGEYGKFNHLIKNEADIVRYHVGDEHTSVGNVTDSFKELIGCIEECQNVHNEAVPVQI